MRLIHFIRIPKTASQSIKNTKLFMCNNHVPWKVLRNKYDELWERIKTFCVVRNPYDRMVSCYFCGKERLENRQYPYFRLFEKYKSFNDFCLDKNNPFIHDKVYMAATKKKNKMIKHPHFRKQVYWIQDENSNIAVDFVLRYENLHKEWKQFLQRVNMNFVELPKHNESKHREYNKYYNIESARFVYEKYEEDFERLGYNFDSYKEKL